MPNPRPGTLSGLDKEETLATGKRRRESVSGFTSLFADGVLHSATREVADALLEILDVFLVGGGELVDLVWRMSVFAQVVIVHCKYGKTHPWPCRTSCSRPWS